jgi:leucyl/phenylalanyl-tRNA---protein transferase
MFPPVDWADENGVLCWGGELTPQSLIEAYSRGIFPWPHRGLPLLWFAPPQRALLFFDELHVGSRLRRYLKKEPYEIRFNTSFEQVMRCCGAPRMVEGEWERGTWITKPIRRAYMQMHQLGLAHSVEAWQNGKLVGGLYGVGMGGYFAGESMFHLEDNASKACVLALIEKLKAHGSTWLDCETMTPHFERLGAREVPREEFTQLLEASIARQVKPFA